MSLWTTYGVCYDVNMKRAQIEPGLLSLFRLSNILWLAIYIPGLSVLALTPSKTMEPLQLLSALNAGIVLLYLCSRGLQRRMGQWYLPGALLAFSLGAVMTQWLEMVWRIYHHAPPEKVFIEEGYLAGALFVPLIVVSAQYNFRGTLVFTLGASALDFIFSLVLIPVGGAPVSKILGGIIGLLIIFPVVGLVVVRLVAGQKTDREVLVAKNIKLTRYAATVERLAVSHERNRMARELHDTLAHTLSAVAVQVEALDKQLDRDPDNVKHTVKQLRDLSRSGLQEVRRALQALRASPLEDLGLTLAMRHLVDSVAERSGLRIILDLPNELDELSPEVEQGVYRITEEALNNTVRHANARTARVSLQRDRGELRLTIADDGLGFDPETELLDGHYGLVGMRERALLCNGQLNIDSTPGTGTTVCLTVEA
jgi:signal transduction histidine kinase